MIQQQLNSSCLSHSESKPVQLTQVRLPDMRFSGLSICHAFSSTNRRTKLSKVLFVVLHVMFYCIELSKWLSVARRFSSARIGMMPEKHGEPWAPQCVLLKALNTFFLSLNRFCHNESRLQLRPRGLVDGIITERIQMQ